jgi:hypothetical protein
MFLARGLCYLISIESITIDRSAVRGDVADPGALPGGFLSPGALIALVMLLLAIWLAHFTPSGAPCTRSAATSSRR